MNRRGKSAFDAVALPANPHRRAGKFRCVAALLLACGFGNALADGAPPRIPDPKPAPLRQAQTRQLHRQCLRQPAERASYAACTRLIQSGQLPFRDVAAYRERRAMLAAGRGDFASAIADLDAAIPLDSASKDRLERLRARYRAEQSARSVPMQER